MSVGNLIEQFLYQRLPDAVITGDEMGYIQALVSGYQDRLEDIRAYAKHLDDFWTPGALPTGQTNVVLVDLTSDQGKTFTRSLDINTTTPPAGSARLPQWAALQLDLPLANVSNVRYGFDPLRAVDTSTLSWLAATVGTLLYQTDLMPDSTAASAAQVELVQTWFPRLKIKGTADSFEVLGRILGFDDVRMTPLWTRLSPRVPDDVGNPSNDPDFAAAPEYFPQQEIGPFYDPFAYRDGPFFAWTGTASNGTNSTSFYTETITGHNPWVDVVLLGSLAGTNIPAVSYGTVVHPAAGSYALDHGAPYTKAYVDCPGSSIRFQAVADGDAFNGLHVSVATAGTLAFITVIDRLSAIKYRSSYFDLGLTAEMDKVEEIFGSRGATVNKDLKANPTLTAAVDGTAVSPYRPWVGGSVAVARTAQDWITSDGTVVTSVVTARVEADPATGDRQLNMDSLVAAGVQTTQAFEEVRAATRLPRRSASGFLIDDESCYAPYPNGTNLFRTTSGTTFYSGSSHSSPQPNYVADISVIFPTTFYTSWLGIPGNTYIVYAQYDFVGPFNAIGTMLPSVTGTIVFYDPVVHFGAIYQIARNGTYIPSTAGIISTGTVPVQSEINPLNQNEYIYKISQQPTSYQMTGSYDFTTGSYGFSVSDFQGVTVHAHWTLVDSIASTTEVIRPEPDYSVKLTGIEGRESTWAFSCLPRPEDDDNGLLYEVADDYPWRREIVVGGELVELDSYYAGTEIAIQPVEEATAFNDQTGVDINVFGITSKTTPYPRIVTQARSTVPGQYKPGYAAIGYKGTIKSLASLTPGETALIRLPSGSSAGDTETDYDVLFEPGYSLFHVGLAQGVLVADLPKFFGKHHYEGLQQWYAFNEHVDDDLTVVDHSYRATVPNLLSISYGLRQWDTERGWFLRMDAPSVVYSEKYLDIVNECTLSFWIRLRTLPSGETTVIEHVPLRFTITAGGNVVGYAKQTNGTEATLGSVAISDSQWHFVYIRRNAIEAVFGVGTLSAAATELSVAGAFAVGDPDNDGRTVAMGAVDIHDLRIWNKVKTAADMDLVRYHVPTPTLCTYRLGFCYTLDRQDKYGVRVLPSGWALLDVLPAWYRRTSQGLVLRYDSMGSYIGETRFKETGVGDHRPLPDQVVLGQQFITLTADGTAPFSTNQGQLPGWNAYWQASNYDGTYVVLPYSGSTATGIVDNGSHSGTNSTWPNTMVQTNPFRQYIWVNGSNTGTIFQVSVENTLGVPTLKALPMGVRAMEVPSGAYVLLSESGSGILVANPLTSQGSIMAYGGTNSTPPLYFYTPTDVNVQVPNAFTVWTDANAATAQQMHVDVSDMPSIANVTAFGTYLNTPVLGRNGVMEFSNTGTIFAGVYELTVVSGQVGQADTDFSGFAVNINVNDTVLQRRLLRGLGGYNFMGTDTFQFTLADGAVGAWVMTVEWTNALDDTAKGTKRQLALYSYSLRQIHTTLFRVTVLPTQAQITQLSTADYNAGTTPGGWFITVNSYGTQVGYKHESDVYTSNDTVVSVFPLADTLTGSTNERRNDIIYTGTDVVISDAGSFVFPSFGSLVTL